MQKPDQLLKQLGLTDSEVTVYLAMCRGLVRVQDVMKATRLKRPTVYYALARLQERGLIHHTSKGSGERYGVEPAERLVTIAKRQVKESSDLEKEIVALAPSLTEKSLPGEHPHVSFYEGVDAIKNVIMETLYCRVRHIDSIAPNDNFFWQVGGNFAETYVSERARRLIKTRNLWESDFGAKHFRKGLYQDLYRGISEIRIVPPAMRGKSATTIFLFDEKTLYISSLKNAYALLVTSQEHNDAMKAMFDGLWAASKPIKE